jgi:prepilin-type N-terminal cleavage/methylation domain-containing protein
MNKIIRKSKYQKGMTLVELMVVLAIFLMVAGITMFDYSKFRSNVSLQNLGDDIALSVRRAQNFAIGVKSSQSTQFDKGYGIHFSTATPDSNNVRAGSNKAFIIFNDITVNKNYDYTTTSVACNMTTLTGTNECIDMLNITSGDTVSAICPNGNGDGVTNCISGSAYADITFIRPNPDASICTGTISGGIQSACSVPVSKVDIVIKNTQSQNIKVISVSSVGQISIR